MHKKLGISYFNPQFLEFLLYGKKLPVISITDDTLFTDVFTQLIINVLQKGQIPVFVVWGVFTNKGINKVEILEQAIDKNDKNTSFTIIVIDQPSILIQNKIQPIDTRLTTTGYISVPLSLDYFYKLIVDNTGKSIFATINNEDIPNNIMLVNKDTMSINYLSNDSLVSEEYWNMGKKQGLQYLVVTALNNSTASPDKKAEFCKVIAEYIAELLQEEEFGNAFEEMLNVYSMNKLISDRLYNYIFKKKINLYKAYEDYCKNCKEGKSIKKVARTWKVFPVDIRWLITTLIPDEKSCGNISTNV